MLNKWIVFIFSAALMLSACRSPVYNQTEKNVADVKLRTAALRHQSDCSGKPSPALVVKDGLYVDTTPISLEQRPGWLESPIVIKGDQLPFSYYSRTIARGAGKYILTKYQPGLDASINVSLNYSGSIRGALDVIASKTGYVYTIRNNKIYWQAFVTRTFDVAFMPGSSDYLMGKSGGGGSSSSASSSSQGTGQVSNYVSSDSSDSEYSSLSGKLSIWTDLEATVRQLLTPEGKVTVSQATTSVTVRDKPANIELVSQYIANLNKNLSKQVLVKVQILQVDLQNDYEFGINWATIVKAFHNSNFVINGNYGTPVSITSLTPQPNGQSTPQLGSTIANAGVVPGYTILFNALNQQGKTSIVTEPRVVCLNNQVSVIRIVEQEGYLASIQQTSVGGSSTLTAQQNTVTSQVTPGTVITGLTLYILPKILGNNIYMQVNADLSVNREFKTFGPTNAQIQLPQISEKHFNQRSMIKSGDTLILSGFRQLKNTANANQFLNSQALGGKGSSEENSETIVLITPFLLNGCLG